MARSGWMVAVALAATASVLSACGSASVASPPTGIDQLVIPTPDVAPRDFVTGIDNPWLPLVQDATWTYDASGQVEGGEIQGGVGSMTVSVLGGTTRIDGVAATAVRSVVQGTTPAAGPADTTVDYYAQDRSGNVWWFGRAGDWQAGRDGAQAGLAMPADPRRGDGWREGYRPGVVEDRAQVEAVDGEFSVPRGHFRDILDLLATSDLAPGIAHERSYVRGIGLVREYAVDGPAELLELVSGP